MDFVVAFCRGAFARPIRDGMENGVTIAIRMRLRNDSEYGETRGIRVERDRQGCIEMTENRRSGEEDLEAVEGFLRDRGPFEGWRALGPKKRRNRHDYTRVAIDKAAVEIGKSKEHLDVRSEEHTSELQSHSD